MEKTLKVRIKEEMKKRGIKIPALAQQTGIPKDRIYGWYRDDSNPKAEDQSIIEKWIIGENSVNKVENGNRGTFDKQQAMGKSQVSAGQFTENLATNELLRAITTVVESNKGLVDSNKAVTDTNRVIADTNAILAQKLVKQESTVNDPPGIPADALATIMALREQVIELTSVQLNISVQEAESVLGIKAVAAMKKVSKTGTPADGRKTSTLITP